MADRSKELQLPRPPRAIARTEASRLASTLARDAFGREVAEPSESEPQDDATQDDAPRREAATESIGRRAGALSDELDFPEFVASLVHGTFDAIVDASIRQMESFADLVAAVAKPVDEFTRDNVSANQARDWLVEQYPKDLVLIRDAEVPHVAPRVASGGDEDGEPSSPEWLADFDLAGEQLTDELIEEQLLPRARERVARNRLQTLATMVLLGMNRVVVRDGTIAARLRFRAAAADHTKVDYATGDDAAPATEWGRRGSRTFSLPSTKVSTVGVNVQTDSELKAELFGEVKINFASDVVPLDRFVDDARRTLLERNARPGGAARARPAEPAPAPPGVAPGSAPATGVAAAPPPPSTGGEGGTR